MRVGIRVNGKNEQIFVKNEQKMGKTEQKKIKIKICEKRTQKVEKRTKTRENRTKTKIINIIQLMFFNQFLKDFILIFDIKFIRYFDLKT
jgi:hypothetical protein